MRRYFGSMVNFQWVCAAVLCEVECACNLLVGFVLSFDLSSRRKKRVSLRLLDFEIVTATGVALATRK